MTAAGSPDSWEITVTLLRSPQVCNCSRAAARKVSPAASSTLLPWLWKYLASLPIDVVLPAPLTPAIMITKGEWPDTSSGCSSGCSTAWSASDRAFWMASGVFSLSPSWARVLARPANRRSRQDCLAGAASAAGAGEEAGEAAGAAVDSGVGCGVDFFRKLNMGRVVSGLADRRAGS